MAKGGVTIQFRGGEKLDRALSRIANVKQSKATSIVYSALGQGATQVKKAIAKEVPLASKDTTGFKTESRNTTIGQLRRSLKSQVKRRAKVGKNTFLASVTFMEGGENDGYFAGFLVRHHKPNAFGFAGGHAAFLKRGVKNSESNFKNKVGGTIAKKIAAFGQLEINKV